MAQTGPNWRTMGLDYNGRRGTPGLERIKAAHAELVEAGLVAHATREDPLPPVPELREQMLCMLRAAALTPGSATSDQIQAARVVLQCTAAMADPLAELQKRLGSRQKAIAWGEAYVARLKQEQAEEAAAGKALEIAAQGDVR